MMNKILLANIVLNFTMALGQSPIQPSILLPASLRRVLTDYEKAWSQKDAAALAQLFAEDGFVLSSGAPMVLGPDAIKPFYTGAPQARTKPSSAKSCARDIGRAHL